MDLSAFMKQYADDIGGQYTTYDNSHSIIIVPVPINRFQTVIGTIKQNELYNRRLISLMSKVCAYHPGLELKGLLEESAHFNYCKFIISDNYLQVEAVASIDNTGEEVIREMIQEAANLADQYEMKLTGADVH